MIQINKQGNAIVIEFTDNDKYLFDGTIEIAPNELMVVVDESEMATFKRVSNGDTLFSQKVEDIQINGITAAKDTVIDLFGSIGYTSGGGGGTGGAVSSVNGLTGDVVITAAGIGAMTKNQADAAYQAKGEYATKNELEEKQEVFQVNAPMAFERDEATLDLHLSINLGDYAKKTDLNSKQDTLVSGTNIKTINNQNILGEGNIEITGGSSATVYNCNTYDSLENSNTNIYIEGLTADSPYKVGDIIHVTSKMYSPEHTYDLEIVGIYNFPSAENQIIKRMFLTSMLSDVTCMYIDTQNIMNINKYSIPLQPRTFSTSISADLGTQETYTFHDGVVYNLWELAVRDSVDFIHNEQDELGNPIQKNWTLQIIGRIPVKNSDPMMPGNSWAFILSGIDNVTSYILTFGYDDLGQVGTLTANSSSEITIDADLSPMSENPVQNKVITDALANKQDKSDAPVTHIATLNDDLTAMASPSVSGLEGTTLKLGDVINFQYSDKYWNLTIIGKILADSGEQWVLSGFSNDYLLGFLSVDSPQYIDRVKMYKPQYVSVLSDQDLSTGKVAKLTGLTEPLYPIGTVFNIAYNSTEGSTKLWSLQVIGTESGNMILSGFGNISSYTLDSSFRLLSPNGSFNKTYTIDISQRPTKATLNSSSTVPISGLNPNEPKIGDTIQFNGVEIGQPWSYKMQIVGIEDELNWDSDMVNLINVSYYYLVCPELNSTFKIKCSDPTSLIQLPLMRLSDLDLKTINGQSIIGLGNIIISNGALTTLITTTNLEDITEAGITLSPLGSWDVSMLNIGDKIDILSENREKFWDLTVVGKQGAMTQDTVYYFSGNDSKRGYKILSSDINKIYPINANVDAVLSADSTNPVQNKIITSALSEKANNSTVEALSTEVATVLTNVTNLTSKVNEDSEKIASLDTEMGNKQNTLVSGTNIKTINGLSVLGEGDVVIKETVDTELSTESENPVLNKVITNALNGKQAAGDYALKSEIPDTSGLATKTEVNTLSQEVEHKADKTTVYTMDEVNTKLATKQATLVAGANITLSDPDTEGKVTISATQPDISGITTTVEELTGEVATLSTDKQDKLVSGTSIKTINGESVLGSGDLSTDVIYEMFPGILVGGDATKLEANKKIYDLIKSGVYPRIYTSVNVSGKTQSRFFASHIEISETDDSITIDFEQYSNNKGTFKCGYYCRIYSDGHTMSLSNRTINHIEGVSGNYIIKDSVGNLQITLADLETVTTKGAGVADAYDVKQYVDAHAGSTITVDTAMSDTSENAVQNKVIKAYIDSLVGNILTQLQEINGTN